MTKKRMRYLAILVVLCITASVACMAACNPKKPNEQVDINETNPLVLQTSELDGVFNPFFASSAFDMDVLEFVNVGLLSIDASGAIVANDAIPTVAKSYNYDKEKGAYEIILKNGLKFSDGTPITVDDVMFNFYVYLDPKYDGSTTMYTLPIEGLTEFRTQTTPEIASKYGEIADFIFSLGSELDEATYGSVKTTPENSYEVNFALYKAYWSYENAAGKNFAQEIVNYVLSNYGTDSYVKANFHPGISYSDLTQEMKIAFGMAMWGFGGFVNPFSQNDEGNFVYFSPEYIAYDANNPDHQKADKYNKVPGEYIKDVEGKYVKTTEDIYVEYDANAHAGMQRYEEKYNKTGYNDLGEPNPGDYVLKIKSGYVPYDATEHVGKIRYQASYNFETAETETAYNLDPANSDKLTVSDYWDEIKAAYGNNYSEEDGINYETAGTNIETFIKELFIQGEGSKEVSGGVKTIKGITVGKTSVAGVEHDMITIKCTKEDPKTILQFTSMIAPKAYYTKGFKYNENAINNYGVEFNNSDFIMHLKSKNSLPVGAGAYAFKEYKDNVVYFERNTNFDCFGLGNAKIKYLRMKVISSGQEYNAVKADEVHFANVPATSDVVNEVSSISKLSSIFVDNLGYGYICVNPTVFTNINERIALQTVFNLALVSEYYPSGLAEIIYRSMSKISWAYPQDAKAIYDYDATGAAAKEYFIKAGYTWDEDNNILKKPGSDEQANFEMYIPSSASDHPAGRIFVNAKTILESIGATARIVVDTNLISSTRKGNIPIYALAWQAALDPDMYQVYHWQSAASSITQNGIKYLHDKGDDAFGTINWDNTDINQTKALEELAKLIEEGTDYMDVADRAPVYEKALELLAKLAIEIPTYQRKNLFVYNKDVIDATTLPSEITPYWEPMAEIWNVSFKK